MATRSLSDMRTRVRERVGLPSTADPSDATLDRWINEALARRRAELVLEHGEDWETTSVAFVVASDVACSAGTSTPIDCGGWLAVRDVEINYSGLSWHIPFGALGDRVSVSTIAWPRIAQIASWHIVGSAMRFDPSGALAGATGTIWYSPELTELSGAATVRDVNGWTMLAVLDVAIRARRSHREDATDLEAELTDAKAHVARASRRNRACLPTIVRRDGW